MLTNHRSLSILVAACLALLVLLLTATTSLAAKEKKMKIKSSNHADIMSVSKMMRILFGQTTEYEISTTATPTELLVIGAGFGRTGTTSYMAALERLGLQSYHMKAVLGTPGHLDMWMEYMTEKKQQRGDGNGKVSKEQANKVITGLAAAGFDATASFPACLLFQDLMERYPNARIVVTVRGDGNGQAWATSILNSVGLMLPAIQRIPFRWISKLQQFATLLPIMWEEIGAPVNATTFLPERNDLARAYDAWLEHVQSVVGPDSENRLLFFAAQSGWQPLCDFLSPVHADIETSCREILESGESYPRANESAMVQNLLLIFGAISWTCEHALYILVVTILLLVTIKKQSRRRRNALVDKNKKKE